MIIEGEIINTLDVDDEHTILIVKKVKKNPKLCGDCPNFKYFGDLSIHYCDKYKGIVESKDICIEVGM